MPRLEALPPRTLIVLAVLGGLTFQLLFGTSYTAAFLDPVEESRGVPVGVVNLDEGSAGAAFLARLQDAESPAQWVPVEDERALDRGLAEKRFRGGLVIPSNFSADLATLESREPRPAFVTAFTNPGASRAGALVVDRVLGVAIDRFGDAVRDRAFESATLPAGGTGVVTVAHARVLAEPVHVTWREANPVSPAGAAGLAPVYIAMGAWMGGYVGAIALDRFSEKTRLTPGRRFLVVTGAAMGHGVIATGAVMAVGLRVPDALTVALLVAVGTWMAYAVVGLLTDLFGIVAAVPAFALLAIGLPASGGFYPVEMLPPFYAALHAWDPFTWLVEALRSSLYAPHAGDVTAQVARLAALALAATGVSLAWARVRPRHQA